MDEITKHLDIFENYLKGGNPHYYKKYIKYKNKYNSLKLMKMPRKNIEIN